MINFDFEDWGRYGITDFEPESENALRTAIDSGECFDTDWHSTTKEFSSARICRDEDGIEVTVSSDGLDDAMEQWDLFSDFLTNEEMDMLTDKIVERIRYYLCMGDFVQEIEYSEILPYNATFEDVVKCMERLEQDCADTLHQSFLECIGTTLYILYDAPEDQTFITERIKKYE